MAGSADDSLYERIYAAVHEVPRGRVTTYGTISELVTGRPSAARTVGWALAALDEARHDEVPWWRVINAKGRISISGWPGAAEEQRRRCEVEGIRFDERDRTDLDAYGWFG